jgi:hypothetical protein
MNTILDTKALSNLLRKNWTSFIDKTRLIAYILQIVREINFPAPDDPECCKATPGLKLTLSQAELSTGGLLLWIEFSVPMPEQKAKVGTCEALLSPDGTLESRCVIGQTLKMG